MTDPALTAQHFDALKQCDAPDVHVHLSRALHGFRFVPRAERRAYADALSAWANEHTETAPLKRACAVLVQAVDRLINEEHQAVLHLCTEARAGFTELGDRDGVGLCAMLIGATYRTLGNYDLALKVLWEAYELLKTSGRYPVFLAADANSIANIDLDLGHLEEARSMFHIAYEQSELGDDFYFKIYALQGLGRVYLRMDKRAKAMEMFQQALTLAEAHNHPLHISNSLTEFATLHFQSGDLDEAEALSIRALAIREQHRLLGGAVTNCIRLAEIHIKRREWTQALSLLARGLAIAEELSVKPKMAQVHQLLSEVYERTQDPERSLVHYKRFHELREHVEREDSARKAADAKLVFEAERVRSENIVIKQQKAEIQRQNRELQDTIDELTRAKIGRKAKAMTLGIVIVLFIFQDLILGNALRLLASDNYFLSLGVKMGIIFSLAPINRGIERHLLKRVIRADVKRDPVTTAPKVAA